VGRIFSLAPSTPRATAWACGPGHVLGAIHRGAGEASHAVAAGEFATELDRDVTPNLLDLELVIHDRNLLRLLSLHRITEPADVAVGVRQQLATEPPNPEPITSWS
jgi:hypothetical protein